MTNSQCGWTNTAAKRLRRARKALTGLSPDEIVNQVKDAGLKGRGGAGFFDWPEMEPDAERRIHEHPLPAV